MEKAYDIVIIGGGLIGSAMGLWLANNTDLSLALVERNKSIELGASPNQRVVALGDTAVSLLTDLGVFQALDLSTAYPYKRMIIWDENSNGELQFDADRLNLGRLGYIVDSLACTRQLQQAAQTKDCIDTYFTCDIERIEFGNKTTTVATSHGRFTARLVLGADGSKSQVRRAAGIFANRRSYDQQGIVARVSCSKPHQDTAWQQFLSTGPVACLPLSGNECSIVWSAETPLASELMALNDEEFSLRLERAIDNRLGNLELSSKRQSFPLQSQHAERYYRRNTVLIGDAAHTIHPLAGQGANLGFKDILLLGKLIQNADVATIANTSVLAKYQRIRQRDNQQTDALMSALDAAYRYDAPLWMALRGAGMNWLNRRHAITALLAEQAMGVG